VVSRRALTTVWLVGAATALYIYFFHREALEDALGAGAGASLAVGGVVYLALGCLRGFTFIPATSLVLLGVVVFPPQLLFVLTLAGILVSSASVYYFAGALHVEQLVKGRYRSRFDRLRGLLERHGFAIVAGWSFFPLVPTDLVCYAGGIVKMPIGTVLAGVALGEGAICAVYIFLGDTLLRSLGLRS
jgi:uncharacterized membrane protein YdjX (TVP38/TMEM64 family)